jgi:hypothetical protein
MKKLIKPGPAISIFWMPPPESPSFATRISAIWRGFLFRREARIMAALEA